MKQGTAQHSLCTESVEFHNGYALSLFDSITSKSDEWLKITPDNIFFSIPFLDLIEKTPPAGIKPFYAIMTKNGEDIGVLSLQLKEIDLSESMNFEEGFERQNFLQKYHLRQERLPPNFLNLIR